MEKVIVDRKEWYRGNGFAYSALVVDKDKDAIGKMCCLGFACMQLEGIPKEDINGVVMPWHYALKKQGFNHDTNDIPNGTYVLKATFRHSLFHDADELEKIGLENDAMFDDNKEDKLKELFLKAGVELEFIN